MAGEDILQRVREQFPGLEFMLSNPEVAPLLIEAVDPNAGFSPTTFEAKLHETNWWKTTSRAQREAEALHGTDPASYVASQEAAGSDLVEWLHDMGVTMSMEEIQYIRTSLVNNARNLSDSQAQIGLRDWLWWNRDRISNNGAIAGAAKQVAAIARSEYFLDMSHQSAYDYGIQLATGSMAEPGIRSALHEMAAGLHPHLRGRLDKGETMADIINPLREIAAKELEYSSIDEIDMNSNDWKWLIAVPDGAGTAPRLPTAQEVSQHIRRTKPQWWQTTHGREADASMSLNLLNALGKVA